MSILGVSHSMVPSTSMVPSQITVLCSVQPWRCSTAELRKGCVLLRIFGMSVDFILYVDVYVIHRRHHHHHHDFHDCHDHHHHNNNNNHHRSYYQIQHICHRGWMICWSLMRICWCYFQIQLIFVKEGGGLLIPYEDKLMLFLIQHICQSGWWVWSSLMKISWCYSLFNIFVRAGGGFDHPLWR